MLDFANGKRILFITTKNLDYIRNTQEIKELKKIASHLTIIGSTSKSYPKRLLHVYAEIAKVSMKKFDLVFIGFAPQLVLPIWGRKLKKAEIAIDFFISVYDTMVCDRKKVKDGTFAARWMKNLDRKTIAKSDHVIADTKAHGDFFVKELGAKEDSLEILYLEADSSIYYPRNVEKSSECKNRFVVLYFGSIIPLQGVPYIFDAMRQLKDDKSLYFYMIGPVGNEENAPVSENIEYINWLSQEKLAEKIAESDLCLAGHFNGEVMKARRTIPGKAYIYEAMGKPMILGDNDANHELYTEDGKHYFVTMSDGRALADKIKEVQKNLM